MSLPLKRWYFNERMPPQVGKELVKLVEDLIAAEDRAAKANDKLTHERAKWKELDQNAGQRANRLYHEKENEKTRAEVWKTAFLELADTLRSRKKE